MIYTTWQRGAPIGTPVYLDANVLVGATFRNHPLYRTCAAMLAQLLGSQHQVLISAVVLSEHLWATCKLCYCDVMKKPPHAHFNKSLYKKWHAQIFGKHGTTISGINALLGTLVKTGSLGVVPDSAAHMDPVMNLTFTYMQQARLTAADAMHLAIAETYARTFVTADGDYRGIAAQFPGGQLTVLHLAP